MGVAVEDVLHRAGLHNLAGVHHRHPVRHAGHHAQIVGNQDDGRVGLLFNLRQQVHNLGLDGHVQGRGGLDGNEHLGVAGEGHGNHGALAHAAGKLVGILLGALLGVGDVHQLQVFNGLLLGLLGGEVLVVADGLHNLLAHLLGGV